MQAIVRVELHGANKSHYDVLHKKMMENGFSRTVIGQGGTALELPTAEYYYEGDAEGNLVREFAKSAAEMTGCKYIIFVSVITTWLSYGLQQAHTYNAWALRT